jgi:hypothetical protein
MRRGLNVGRCRHDKAAEVVAAEFLPTVGKNSKGCGEA